MLLSFYNNGKKSSLTKVTNIILGFRQAFLTKQKQDNQNKSRNILTGITPRPSFIYLTSRFDGRIGCVAMLH